MSSGITEDCLEDGYLRILFACDFTDSRKALSQIQDLYKNIEKLLKDGRATQPIYFTGSTVFTVDGKAVKAGVAVGREGDEYVLTADRNDLKEVSSRLEIELTDAEIELLSKHVMRIPYLIKVREYVERIAKSEKENNPSVPIDAYRHVLWSYLVTKAYGPQFARGLTDAHETSAKSSSDVLDKWMDYTNNYVGMRYAMAGYQGSSIKWRVMQDPEIIRSTNGVSLRNLLKTKREKQNSFPRIFFNAFYSTPEGDR